MARSTSKQKGAGFEREICKALSLWVSGGKHEDLFWRSAMSGGRATVGRKTGKSHERHAGDISATSPEGHVLTDAWYVECKFYKDLDIKSALIEGKGKLAQFWRETCEQATHYKRMPMLIAKQNNVRQMLITPRSSMVNPAGVHPLRHTAMLGRLWLIDAEVFCFKTVMATPFSLAPKSTDYKFLKPGELARILGHKPKVVRAKIKKGKL